MDRIFVPAGYNPGAGIGSQGNGAPGPCPACPGDVTCTGPYACLTSDGCTYGLCSTAGFGTNPSLCNPQYSASGFCAASAADYVCADPMESRRPGIDQLRLAPARQPGRGVHRAPLGRPAVRSRELRLRVHLPLPERLLVWRIARCLERSGE